ncbi:MAG: GPI inositol-deacylase [Actinomycetota bacterium]|nr:GPI inositol-deacylase [Actinomycetota bacterium]
MADDDGMAATGIVGRFGVTRFWTPFPGYNRHLAMLASPFSPAPVIDDGSHGHRNLLADIAAVPYDFRRSIAAASQAVDRDVRARRKARRGSAQPDRFIVVAHSLGGLVARHWLATSEEAAAGCDHLVTLGTPHQGSPKALDVLVNGVRAAGRTWKRASDVLRAWPSLYQLVPRYRAVLDGTAASGLVHRPYELSLPHLRDSFMTQAVAIHQAIDDGWAPGGPAGRVTVTPFVGVAQETCLAFRWDGRRLHREAGTPAWFAGTGRLGDGTVPDGAAEPKGGDGTRVRDFACRHGWLVSVNAVAQFVRKATDPESEPFLGPAARPVAGTVALDLESDLLVAGETVQAYVRLRTPDGALVGPGVATPVARLRPVSPGAAPVALTCVAVDGPAWRVQIPRPSSGQFVVEASAPGWLGPEPDPVRELLTVVSAEDVADAAAADGDDGGAA